MASVILATAPIHGHVSAYLPIARHLVARGDYVRFVTGSRFAEVVADTGAVHVALASEAEFDDRLDFNATFPERAKLRGTAAIAFDVETFFVKPGRGQYDALVDTIAAEPTDVVVADPVFIGAAHLLGHAAEQRPGVLVGSHLPLPLDSRDTAPYGMGLTPAPFLNRAATASSTSSRTAYCGTRTRSPIVTTRICSAAPSAVRSWTGSRARTRSRSSPSGVRVPALRRTCATALRRPPPRTQSRRSPRPTGGTS